MPSNVSRSAQFYDKEVLAYPQDNLVERSIVLDANAFAQNSDPDQRTVVEAGTILMRSVTLATQFVQYDGTNAVEGILSRPVDLIAQSTAGWEAASMFFHEAIFATTQVVSFTTYASALVSTLTTCKFV